MLILQFHVVLNPSQDLKLQHLPVTARQAYCVLHTDSQMALGILQMHPVRMPNNESRSTLPSPLRKHWLLLHGALTLPHRAKLTHQLLALAHQLLALVHQLLAIAHQPHAPFPPLHGLQNQTWQAPHHSQLRQALWSWTAAAAHGRALPHMLARLYQSRCFLRGMQGSKGGTKCNEILVIDPLLYIRSPIALVVCKVYINDLINLSFQSKDAFLVSTLP